MGGRWGNKEASAWLELLGCGMLITPTWTFPNKKKKKRVVHGEVIRYYAFPRSPVKNEDTTKRLCVTMSLAWRTVVLRWSFVRANDYCPTVLVSAISLHASINREGWLFRLVLSGTLLSLLSEKNEEPFGWFAPNGFEQYSFVSCNSALTPGKQEITFSNNSFYGALQNRDHGTCALGELLYWVIPCVHTACLVCAILLMSVGKHSVGYLETMETETSFNWLITKNNLLCSPWITFWWSFWLFVIKTLV